MQVVKNTSLMKIHQVLGEKMSEKRTLMVN